MSAFFIISILILLTIIWFNDFIDILISEFTENNKLIWIIVFIILPPPFCTFLYARIGKDQRVREDIEIVKRREQPNRDRDWKI